MQNYIQENQDRFVAELMDWLRIPSISTDKNFKNDVLRAAEFVAEKLRLAGADKVEICPTAGNPIVYAEKMIDPKLPTVLYYGHYDVQPADPLELWTSPPFEPQIKNETIYARGASDDKGQVYMHIKAFEMMVKHQKVACNMKFMIEGEEEIGSEHLTPFVKENKEKLKSDVILISDTNMLASDCPSITVGLRGLAYVEVEVTGTNRDLHSGLYGGAVVNPINALAAMIAKLKDDKNRITVPNFYDKVLEVSPAERLAMSKAPFDENIYKNDISAPELSGEIGFSALEHVSIRPTLDVNGIWGGYTGEGAKTVIAAKAYAKISMRLVPNQEPNEIANLFKKYFESIAPKSVNVQVHFHHGGQPYVTDTQSVAYQAAEKAVERTFGKKPIPMRGGGSIPIVAMFKQELQRDSILMGFGLDSDAIHSPNEHFGIFNFLKGIETIPYFYQYLAEMS
ncbi:MAG: dipeptidase [Bacteroidetes bacterium]|nr:MAG: dipeptidase [Bacteroidota bacterium]